MTIKRKLLLTSAAFAVVTAAPFGSKAADGAADPNDFWAAHGGVSFSGEFEVGGRAFIQRPPKSAFPWVSPTNPTGGGNRSNRSKFEEYGEIPPGFFAEYLRLTLQTNDGTYWNELRADNVGYNNQRYIFDFSKAGEHYFTASWDQIPHLYSTSAQSIWSGVGTNNLTTSVNIPGSLTPQPAANTLSTQGQRDLVTARLNGRFNTIDVGIQRDKGAVAYKWTPDANWDVKANYSHETRVGTQIMGFPIGGLGNLQQMQVPRPVDDTTQIGKLTGQYFGPTPWGGHYNIQAGGGFSLFDNNYTSMTVQNPFSDPTNAAIWPQQARLSLAPNNQAYNGVVTTGLDLPMKTRWNSTLQYTTMRQNDPFIPFTINPLLVLPATSPTNAGVRADSLAALPALSLNGEVNTLLYNTNVTTTWTPELRSTFRYRYYDNDNQTPELLMPAYTVEDAGTAASAGTSTGVPRRSLSMSYTKQNASQEFQWRPAKWATLGSSFGWEQWDRSRRDANVTNEFIGRGTADFKLYDVATLRTSAQYSERRYDKYDGVAMAQYTYYAAFPTSATVATNSNAGTNAFIRKFDMANRNQTKANAFLDITGPSGSVFRDFVITPTVGLRFEDYPDDPLFFGLKKSNTWNAGIDATYTFKPGNWVQASYLYETYDRFQAGSGTLTNSYFGVTNGLPANSSLAAIVAATNAFGSNTHEKVHTFMFAGNADIVPGVLDLKLAYTYAFSDENWDYGPYQNYSMLANGTLAAGTLGLVYGPFPTVRNNYQRLDATLRHTVDPSIVSNLGFAGEVYLKARYVLERSSVDNWQQDMMSPYLYLVDRTVSRLIDMGTTNPNYTAQFVQLSLNAKW